MLPFLALPLAVALRRFPATTTALALVSMIMKRRRATAAALGTRWSEPRALEIAFAGVAVVAWAAVAATAPKPPALGGDATSYAEIAVALVVVTLAACATGWARRAARDEPTRLG